MMQLMGGAAAAIAAPAKSISLQENQQKSAQQSKEQARALQQPPVPVENQPPQYGPDETRMMDEIEDRAAHYFYEQADAATGLIFDRAPATGQGAAHIGIGKEYPTAASIAASGFGISALIVAMERGYLEKDECERRIYSILDYFANRAENVHGFFFHYMDVKTGARIARYELSSIDTALLLCGVLHARAYLNTAKAEQLADKISHRVDWTWMFNGGPTLEMGWKPESGFLKYRWGSYCESSLMFLMAIGSPTHPIPAASWDAIERKALNYGGIRFVTSYGGLFIHQYAHLWGDFRNKHDRHTNYWENSIAATRADKIFCMQQHGQYPWIDESMWGYSAGDNRHGGYTVWAGPPSMNYPDGTLAPHAAGGSLALLPGECLAVLSAMRQRYPKCFGRYGFVDTFRPDPKNEWYDPDVISIDLGLTMLAAENLRTGTVWREFMKNKVIGDAMREVGFVREQSAEC